MVLGNLAHGCHNGKEGFGGGIVEEKMVEKMIAAFDKDLRMVGAASFEEAIEQTIKLTGILSNWILFLHNFLQQHRTIESLRDALINESSLTERDESLLLFALENLPQMVREGLTVIAAGAKATLPPPRAGRRRVFTAADSKKVLDYVSYLNRSGATMPIAKVRAAQKFGCSKRTIDRMWTDRKSTFSEGPPSIQALLSTILKAGEADQWQVPKIEYSR
jgi:hypothetical protein